VRRQPPGAAPPPTNADVATEIEIKLAVDPDVARSALRHPAVSALRVGRTRTTSLVGTYYDTPDSALARDAIALRVRRIGSRWVQTIKGPAAAGAGLHARPEFEWPLARPVPDLARLADTPWGDLIAKASKRGALGRVFTTEVERRSVLLAFPDGTRAELCIDRGTIRAVHGGRVRREPISEIEIELVSGAPSNLYDLALRLAADLPVSVMTTSKAERGHALHQGKRAPFGDPAHAGAPGLSDDAATGDALAELVRSCLRQIAANAPGLLADDDPEWDHQMRIGTRRLRSCLRLVAPLAASPALDGLIADATWLAGALGPSRDWDVFVRETLPPLAAWFARDPATAPGLKRLRARAESRRRASRATAREAVASRRFQCMLLAGGRLCATPRFAAGDDGDDATLALPASAFAATLLARRHRKLIERAGALGTGTARERHEVRIAAKRLRYIAEFFAPLFSRKRARAYLKALSALQDVLGRLNDAATALAVADASGGRIDDAATGAVRGWVAAQAAALEPTIASAWRKFERAQPFWAKN
jgi:triphosphatase